MNDSSKTTDRLALAFAMIVPTVITLIYFQWLHGSESSLQQLAYGIGKVIQFVFPVIYVWLFHRDRIRSLFLGRQSKLAERSFLWQGILFGLFITVSMFVIYFLFLDSTEIAGKLKEAVTEKVNSIGAGTLWKYVMLGIFYAICHSFLEEYYWRWFVFDMLKKQTSVLAANLISSLGFMAHHVILLGFFFGWTSPWTYLISLAIATGGFVWAWIYHREARLRSIWISHLIVDAAIFTLGYFLCFLP